MCGQGVRFLGGMSTSPSLRPENAPLREGFTTGTAAAAAAKAATLLLSGRACPEYVEVALPPFGEKERRLCVAVFPGESLAPREEGGPGESMPSAMDSAASRIQELSGNASVIKDGGDDPDATHGMRITATVSLRPFQKYGPPVSIGDGILLYGGHGIGRVTLPGLPVAVGEPAINPAPREQIARAVREAFQECGHECGRPPRRALHLLISAPEGAERARHTLNARLGIVGGISILGTQGIVRPYSHDAWRCAVEQGLEVARALGLDTVLLSTGRRSERALFGLYPDLPETAGIQAADFAAFALRGAARRHFARVVWGCFPGKLLKLAQGLEWTHAKTAPADLSLPARLCRKAGGPEPLARAMEESVTAAGALGVLRGHSPALHDAVLRGLAEMALAVMRGWMEAEGSVLVCRDTSSGVVFTRGAGPKSPARHRKNPPSSSDGKLRCSPVVRPPALCPQELILHVFSMEGALLLTLTSHISS